MGAPVSTTAIGRYAETAAADYLQQHGYMIWGRNWKRPDCEIDIIARKGRTIYFVEVKYRSTDRAGSGLEYVTSRKIKQMSYAARRWVAEQSWRGEWVLSAIEVSGSTMDITAFIEDINS